MRELGGRPSFRASRTGSGCAALALSEAYGMTGSSLFKTPVTIPWWNSMPLTMSA